MEKIKVLIADDHRLFREGLCGLLQCQDDIECIGVAGDGQETVRLAQELKPDVVLIDIEMPNTNGIEAAKQIKAVCPKTAVLILSAYKHDGYVIASMRAGVDGYLLKDMPPPQLMNAIRMVHDGEGVFSLEAARGALTRVSSTGPTSRAKTTELNSRELEVLKLAAKGMTNNEIARALCLSKHTVRTHFVNIFSKLGTKSRTEALSHALTKGLIKVEDLLPKDEGQKPIHLKAIP